MASEETVGWVSGQQGTWLWFPRVKALGTTGPTSVPYFLFILYKLSIIGLCLLFQTVNFFGVKVFL